MYTLSGGDSVPGGTGVKVLSSSFQDRAVSSVVIEDHSCMDGSCTDV